MRNSGGAYRNGSALGLALAIVASYLTSLGTRAGWYAYAPLTGQAFSPPSLGEPG
jgi:heme/copper-type cytochrome/quinol oxidase subunit 1